MSNDLRDELVALLGAVGAGYSTGSQREELVDGLVLLSRTAILPPAQAPLETLQVGWVVSGAEASKLPVGSVVKASLDWSKQGSVIAWTRKAHVWEAEDGQCTPCFPDNTPVHIMRVGPTVKAKAPPSQVVRYVSIQAIQAMLECVGPHYLGAPVHLHVETGRVEIVPSTSFGTHAVIGFVSRADPPAMAFAGEPVEITSSAPVRTPSAGIVITGYEARDLPVGSQVRAGTQGGKPLLWELTESAKWERRVGETWSADWTAEFADDLPVEIVRVGPAKAPQPQSSPAALKWSNPWGAPVIGRVPCAAPNIAETPSPTHMSHGGEAVLPPEEPVPIEIRHASIQVLLRGLTSKDEGTAVWVLPGGDVSLSAGGGQLIGHVVRGALCPELRFAVPVRYKEE